MTFSDQHRLGFDSRGGLNDLIENEDATGETMLVPIDTFPEVPLEVVEAIGWIDVVWGRWSHRNEDIVVLESGALTRGISTDCFGKSVWRLWHHCLGEQSSHTRG